MRKSIGSMAPTEQGEARSGGGSEAGGKAPPRKMKLYRDFTDLPAQARGSVVALGNFDGLHCGHQAVLEKARQLCQELQAPLAVMTFEPHPRRLFHPELPILRIVPLAERLRLLRDAGVDCVFLQRFTRAFSQTSAQDFIAKILIGQLQVKGVVTGENFLFGHKRGGDSALLAAQKQFHYAAVTVAKSQGKNCSSTRIREALVAGNMEEAALLLTRPYSMTGHVIPGDARGREWGFPTANIRPGKVFLPRFGIYAGTLAFQNSEKYKAVISFGIRPMFRLQAPLLEVHVLDASPDLYHKKVRVELLHYLRPEADFETENALRAQIAEDCNNTRAIL